MGKQNNFFKKSLLKSVIAALLVLSFSSIKVCALENIDAGYYLWRLINEARANPVNVIERYDIDIDAARKALGTENWIFDLPHGLPPLAWNELLFQSSTSHINDMADKMYYGYKSPEGISYEKRIYDTGYEAASTGESLGLLSFNVYLEPLEAVEKVFENMLRDELNPELEDIKNIFSISHTEIGISLKSIIFMFEEDNPFNAYVIAADFASPVEPRHFILGNFYDMNNPVVWNGDEIGCISREDSIVKDRCISEPLVVSDHGWLQEPLVNDVFLYMNYLEGDLSFNVPLVPFSGYQVQVPSQGFFLIQVYDQITGLILKRAGVGMNVNQLIDLGISTY